MVVVAAGTFHSFHISGQIKPFPAYAGKYHERHIFIVGVACLHFGGIGCLRRFRSGKKHGVTAVEIARIGIALIA